MNFKKLFGLSRDEGNEVQLGKLYEGIEPILAEQNEADAKILTGFAGLLGKIAYSDMDTSTLELHQIRFILKRKWKLKEKQLDLIVALLDAEHARLFSIEDYIYTRLINEVFDKDRKLDLLGALFEVAAADDSISSAEDATLWSIAKGLQLSHREFVTVRATFKDHLDVLK